MKKCSSVLLALVLSGLSMKSHAGEEDLAGPPVVTAKSWAVADAKTGEVLWESMADEPRKAASTAKMMCAYTVLKLAEKEPALMDEWVTFSKLADDTKGSTADVTEGEKVRVHDCLYGLLLPSGNDAGNALAEHLNKRLAQPDDAMLKSGLDNPLVKSRRNFIAEMNRNARQIGMTHTTYRSAFGDGGTPEDRTTSVRDLCKLAWTAMQIPAFRQYVSTQRHEAEVKGPGKTTRQAVWENSNQLLSLDLGYDGIKTGTTTEAGFCLVASGHRGADHLYVAVLGATSEEARFADVRNLFRWAWTKRAGQ